MAKTFHLKKEQAVSYMLISTVSLTRVKRLKSPRWYHSDWLITWSMPLGPTGTMVSWKISSMFTLTLISMLYRSVQKDLWNYAQPTATKRGCLDDRTRDVFTWPNNRFHWEESEYISTAVSNKAPPNKSLYLSVAPMWMSRTHRLVFWKMFETNSGASCLSSPLHFRWMVRWMNWSYKQRIRRNWRQCTSDGVRSSDFFFFWSYIPFKCMGSCSYSILVIFIPTAVSSTT